MKLLEVENLNGALKFQILAATLGNEEAVEDKRKLVEARLPDENPAWAQLLTTMISVTHDIVVEAGESEELPALIEFWHMVNDEKSPDPFGFFAENVHTGLYDLWYEAAAARSNLEKN